MKQNTDFVDLLLVFTDMGVPKLNIGADQLSKEIIQILTPDFINQLARETGFIVRESTKLDGYKFLDILLFTEFNHDKLSLNDLCVQLKKRYDIEISKQSMDERFSDCATNFFKKVLSNVIKVQIESDLDIDIGGFERVLIKDSTSFKLPANMAEKYPGGSSTKAGARIQFEYDLKNLTITDLTLHPFNDQDLKNAKDTVEEVNTGDLIVRDLGYIIIEVLRQIQAMGAYYLNRPSASAKIFELIGDKYVEINFKKIIKGMCQIQVDRLDLEVYIGAKELFKTRLIIELLPEQVYKERLKNAIAKAKKKGATLSDDYQARLRLNLIITNTDIPADKVRLLYTLRWQIELMFKIWKSIGEIDKVKKMKVERFEASLIAKLIWVALNWQIMKRIINAFFVKQKIELSPYKLFKTLRMYKNEFREAVLGGVRKLINLINELVEISPKYLVSEKKKDKAWSYDIIRMFII